MLLLNKESIAVNRAQLEVLIEPAALLSCGEFTAQDLIQAGIEERLFVFVSEDFAAVLVTQLCEFFQKKVMFILAMAGRASKLYRDKSRFDELCAKLGCAEIRCACQPKQMRAFWRHGFKPVYTVCGYEIGGVK